jgi:branched-chain amino acid transport system permease protein
VDRVGGFGWPIVAGWLAAAAITATAAAFTGYATLRLKSDYLAITTFGVAVVVQLVALNAQSLTGGPFGVAFIPRPFASVQDQSVLFNLSNLGVIVAVTLAVYLALERLSRSPWGRVLRALREDERAAIALGKSAQSYRIQAFAVGGAVMGLAGAVQAHFIGFIAPDNYLPTLTFQVWAMLMVGGSGSNRGALLGAIVVWAIWVGSGSVTAALVPADLQARAASLQIVAIGVMLCLILLWRPQGFFGSGRSPK